MRTLLLFIGLSMTIFNHAQSCYGTLPVSDNFDDQTTVGVCWDLIDQDGDNNNWIWWNYSDTYGGYKVIASYSYYTSSGALNPDNWIISYPIDLTSFSSSDNIELSYKIRSASKNYAHEYYTVYAATGKQTTTLEASSVKQSAYVDDIGGNGDFVVAKLNVSSLAGNTIYIAFRHHNSTDQSNIEIDEVTISSKTLGIEDFESDNFSFYYSKNNNSLELKSANKPISNITIFNLLGQNVLSKNLNVTNESVNINSLTKGVYIAQITIDNFTKSIKFLIN
ncbi:T9SS-dependent choice-of-anchor J family protein [Aestuariibaculum lutulentum]|uniref:Choice-of-anchor J domain-containing protein n=1 Tax=Aestuariibaculum lutulentum TaxID=2920935 RepID=A0ABS9RK17_9FLAO|nr:choice-of-anchor J domain-containing protein [Aestuariibaculum lutulentum]MCH4553298.1 choice-of-anchor J domain-containing protein [Aestuariibaculum lutulentum]